MPIITASVGTSALTLMWTAILAVIVARPESSDFYSGLGAILACFCIWGEAHGKKRRLAETMPVLIGSAAIGTFGPGALHWFCQARGWLPPETVSPLPAGAWVLSGLIMGLHGWGALHLVNKAWRKRGQKLLGLEEESQPDPPTKPIT